MNSPITINLGFYINKAAKHRAYAGKKVIQDGSILSR